MTAFQGEQPLRDVAQAILSEPNVEFWYSPYLKLELTLQPTYHQRNLELQFYNEYFSIANCWGNLDRMFEIAGQEATKYGISLADAFHVAAASLSGCSLLITTEKPTKPMFRTKAVRVVSILGLSKPNQPIRRLLER